MHPPSASAAPAMEPDGPAGLAEATGSGKPGLGGVSSQITERASGHRQGSSLGTGVPQARTSSPAPLSPLLLLALLAAFWPVLLWYLRGSFDGSNDPWGLLALLAAALALGREPARQPPPARPLLLPLLGLGLYATASLAGLPLSLRAGLAALTLGALLSAWRLGRRLDLPLTGLLLLALPLAASLQFYLGYPLRVLAGHLTLLLLDLHGLPVQLEGATLLWNGQEIAIDAPCSGVRMLWSGLFLMAAAAAWHRFTPRQTLLALGLTLVAVVAANGLRAAALFYLESGLLQLPPWVHDATGLAVFLAAGAGILEAMLRIDKSRPC
ncbi:archaeosortase/exosortase family protein [Azovibrio restrictus]|uniref:archaeosortase/exosortase family protein n=1 Tax=Azovibrio restrictus TaxID=146938 RepID=UPI0026F217D9|nr:archaeosortase/exosortase family protein [Azovibrio restrictus]MDD3481772.1 archaeosortase/exosortase family protein [Azovibrio restrictus]